MRPILHTDFRDAARALLGQPVSLRAALAVRMVREADWADVFTRRSGQAHPLWGNGTLSDAARQRCLVPEPTLDEAEYCDCLMLVLQALQQRGRARLKKP